MEQRAGDRIRYHEIRFLQQETCKTGFKGKEIRTTKSTICYSKVSDLYVDFIPQWGKK